MPERVIVSRDKLDSLAEAVAAKSGEQLTLTIDEMTDAVLSIEVNPSLQSKSVTPTTAVQTVVASQGYDGLSQVTVNPIPTNYGLITYNGSSLMVS